MNNIITLSGDPGSGKSTVRNALKNKIEKDGKETRIYCVGDIFRKLADDNGMTVTEFNQMLEEKNANVDKELDDMVAKYGGKIEKENDQSKVYIIDSRLAWNGIPKSFKVRLTVTDKIAAERIFNDKTRGKEDKYETLEDAMKATMERKESEKNRYIDLYGLDLQNLEQYDLVVDTSYANVEDIVEIIEKCMIAKNNQKPFAKYWKSPKQFMPIQHVTMTLEANGESGESLDEWKKKIKNEGIEIDKPIIAMQAGKTYFVRDGHHRNFGAALAGKTLVPYDVKWKDEENYNGFTTRRFLELVLGDREYDRDLYEYEEFLSKNGEHFCYMSVYPGIEKGKIFEGNEKKNDEHEGNEER